MTKNGSNGEFKGTTREAIRNLHTNVSEVKDEVQSLNRRFWIILIVVTVAMVERLPGFMGVILGAIK